MLSVASTALGMARDAEKCMTSAADSTWTPMPYKNLDKNREYQREYSRRWRVAHPRTRKTVAERFWERVDKCGPLPRADAVAVYPEIAGICCWLWLGAKDRDGYGQTSLDGKSKKAHRVSWFLEHGAWPANLGLHKCDVPGCVRVVHLLDGTARDNSTDMLEKERSARGVKHWKAKLTDAQVILVRALYTAGVSQGQLAKRYKVTQVTISSIVRHENWRHL